MTEVIYLMLAVKHRENKSIFDWDADMRKPYDWNFGRAFIFNSD